MTDRIGSSAFRFSGIASGLDSGALVDALIQLERRPLDLIEARKAGLETRQELYREFNTRLLELRDAARALDNQNPSLTGGTLDEELLAYQAASSDEGVLTATANGNAAPGSTSVRVLSLASVGRRITTTFASNTDPIASSGDTLTIGYQGENDIEITVGAGGASLLDLRDLVNSDPNNGGNVRAEVLFDGSAYRLVLSGVETGAESDLTLASSIAGEGGGPFLDAALTQNAADASLEVLGIPITRSGNEIEDVLPGVTIRLAGTTDALDPADVVDIDVTRDDEAIAGKLQAFADAFNRVRDFVTEQAAFDAEAGRAGPLSGDATVRGIERQIQQLVGNAYSFSETSPSFGSEIGLRFDREGRLELDRDAMSAAFDEDPVAVRRFLAGELSAAPEEGFVDGLATAVARALEPITRSGDGSLALQSQSFDDRIADVERQIERFEERLARREEGLIQRFTALESTVARLQAQAGFLNSIVRF